MTNRWLARVATQVLEGFPGSFGASVAARCIGNPVRADIAGTPEPMRRFFGRDSQAAVLVLGGSQGAQRLNRLLPEALALIAPARETF